MLTVSLVDISWGKCYDRDRQRAWKASTTPGVAGKALQSGQQAVCPSWAHCFLGGLEDKGVCALLRHMGAWKSMTCLRELEIREDQQEG